MVITTMTTLALRCPDCGKLGFYTLSRFAISNGKKCAFTCECGENMAVINYKNKGTVILQIECMLCESSHILTYKAAHLWNKEIKTIICTETGMEIGYIGPAELVREHAQRLDRSMREMAEDMGYDQYFNNPDVMYEVLDILKKMTEEARITCSCGLADLEVEAFPDRIELFCNACDAVGIITAETKEDLKWLKKTKEIVLEEEQQKHFNPKNTSKRRHFNKIEP